MPVAEMTIDQYLQSARESADPKTLLDLVMAESERLKFAVSAREHEFKIASECELDEDFRPRPKNYAQIFRLARVYTDAALAPKAYMESPNPVAAVSIGIQYALLCGVQIPMFLQNSFPVNGKIGIESKLAIALLLKSGQIFGRPDYRIERENGKAVACTCTVVDKDSGEHKSQTVTWDMVTKEGWDKPKGSQVSKWTTLPELMFQYRSGVFVMRVHYPDVLMGMHTIEELDDISRGGASSVSLEELSERMGAMPAGELARPNGAKPKGRGRRAAADKSPASEKTAESAEIPENTTSDSGSDSESVPTATKEHPAIKAPDKLAQASKATVSAPAGAKPSAAPAARQAAHVAPVVTPANVRQSKPETANIVAYMNSLYGEKTDGFDLEKIALEASKQPNWSMFCKSVIEKQRLSWETFLVEEIPDGEEISDEEISDEESQSEPNTDDQVPDCISDPVGRPLYSDPAVNVLEKKIMGYNQAKRIRDCAAGTVKGHPDLSNDEAAYLIDLCERQAWQLEHNLPRSRERQIPE